MLEREMTLIISGNSALNFTVLLPNTHVEEPAVITSIYIGSSDVNRDLLLHMYAVHPLKWNHMKSRPILLAPEIQ